MSSISAITLKNRGPFPHLNFRKIVTLLDNILFMLSQFLFHQIADVASHLGEMRNSINCIDDQMETIDVIEDTHIKGGCSCAFFFVTPNMKVLVIVPSIG